MNPEGFFFLLLKNKMRSIATYFICFEIILFSKTKARVSNTYIIRLISLSTQFSEYFSYSLFAILYTKSQNYSTYIYNNFVICSPFGTCRIIYEYLFLLS